MLEAMLLPIPPDALDFPGVQPRQLPDLAFHGPAGPLVGTHLERLRRAFIQSDELDQLIKHRQNLPVGNHGENRNRYG